MIKGILKMYMKTNHMYYILNKYNILENQIFSKILNTIFYIVFIFYSNFHLFFRLEHVTKSGFSIVIME